jgi:cytidine deaminase
MIGQERIFMKLNKQDLELINIATQVLDNNMDLYDDRNILVACVARAKSGKLYKGVNIKTSHSICAEQVAIGQALACGERELDTIVAVKYNKENMPDVVSPCGLCRYTFDKLNMDFNVIVMDSEKKQIVKVKPSDLLPYPYHR